jgi:hypothetical protein
MRRFDQRTIRYVVIAALVVCVVAMYHPVLSYGIWWDDYMDLRPQSVGEVWSALTGHWSVAGWQDNYHRPLAAIHTALLFQVFGLNTVVLHAVSLVIVTLIVLVIFAWARREVGWPLGATIALGYLAHPVLPNSTVAWVFSQKSALAMLLVALVLRLWVARRASVRWRAWWPLAACAVAGFLYKEDTIMILPALAALQAVRARVWRDVPPPSRALVVGIGGILLALVLVRLVLFPYAEALDLVVADEDPDWINRAALALYPALRALLMIRYNGELMLTATAFTAMLLVAGTWAALRRPQTTPAWLWTQGAVLTAAFSLPLIVAPDFTTMRAHLLVLPGSLIWVAGGLVIWDVVARSRARQVATASVLAVGVVLVASGTWMQMRHRYGPCGFDADQFSSMTETWPEEVIQADTKRWLAKRRQACAEGRTPALWEEMDYVRWRTKDGRTVLVTDRAAHVSVRVHASGGSGNASLQLEGREIARGRVKSDMTVEIPLSRTWRSWLRSAHRIDVVADVPVTLTVTTR